MKALIDNPTYSSHGFYLERKREGHNDLAIMPDIALCFPFL
jgi:hypothetical protein